MRGIELHDPAFIQHQDSVVVHNSFQPMCDGNNNSIGQFLTYGLLDLQDFVGYKIE